MAPIWADFRRFFTRPGDRPTSLRHGWSEKDQEMAAAALPRKRTEKRKEKKLPVEQGREKYLTQLNTYFSSHFVYVLAKLLTG